MVKGHEKYDFAVINDNNYCGNVGAFFFNIDECDKLGFDCDSLKNLEIGKMYTIDNCDDVIELEGVHLIRLR